jgi:hypothetical protein
MGEQQPLCNGHVQAFSTHPSWHGHPPAQSGYGSSGPIPGKQQAHAYGSQRRALCRAWERTWHADHQRGDFYCAQSFGKQL